MEFDKTLQDGILVLRISRQIDSTTGPQLSTELDALISNGHVHMVLDLTDVPYISSAGLRVLSIALKEVRGHKMMGDLCLASLSKTVSHAFRISGFDQVFSIFDTVSEAVAAMTVSRSDA